MIKLSGKYDIGGLESIDCEIKAMNSYLIPRSDKKYLEISRNKELINIRHRDTQKEPTPIDHNYTIEYVGEDNKDHRIFVKLKWGQKQLLKLSLKNHWFQKTEIKVTAIASITTLLLSPIVNDIYHAIKDNNQSNSNLINIYNEQPMINPNRIPSILPSNDSASISPNSNSGISRGNINTNVIQLRNDTITANLKQAQ